MSKLKVLDLFSGIGGFSLGLERSGGFQTAAFCELSAKCRHLLNHHWPEVPTYDDVCSLTADRLRADGIVVDAICGGFPCQDISVAGKGAGLAGERSGLWREFARLIRELRPRLVLVENVAALLGRGLGDVLGDLAALGYDAEWDCIRAFDVGAPHLRARLWIVAYARGVEHQGFGDAFRRALAAELPEAYLANTDDGQRDGSVEALRPRWDALGGGGEAVADAERGGQQAVGEHRQTRGAPRARGPRASDAGRAGWWSTEPAVGRVADGVPARVDRLHGLGNAVIPEIPHRLGRAILAAHQEQQEAA